MTLDTTLLAKNELFSRLDEADAQALMSLAIGRRYAAGEDIFKENEDAYAVCLLLGGRVGLQMDLGNGRRLVVSTVDAGEMFAWSGLIEPHHFTTTAHAIEDCDVAIFKSDDLQALFVERPRLAYATMEQCAFIISQRLRETQLQLVGLFGD
jgi:CRP/FNR family cyclic AMP-dependent transcriptional regulator